MAFCSQCGNRVAEGSAFCPYCGQSVVPPSRSTQPQGAPANEDFFSKLSYMEDTTYMYNSNDINQNKAMAIIGYIGILFLIPLFAMKHSPFCQFHAKQSANLCILSCGVSLVMAVIVACIPWFLYALKMVFVVICSLIPVASLGLMAIGIVNVAMGKAKKLPVIGKLRIIP